MSLKQIGDRIRRLREAAHEVQEDLAAAVGVSRPTINGIENGKEGGSLRTMLAIADHYNVPLDWLLGRRLQPGAPLFGKLIEDPNELALIGFWRSLSPAKRVAVADLLHIHAPPITSDDAA
jgi:transcriptional regulator with XRE-family HTH domain